MFCDNSVRYLSYDMKSEIHQNFATRNDGRVISFDGL